MEVYEIVKSIGSGSFGQVYLAKHKREEKNYVIKKIKTRDMQQKDRENTEQEVRLLQKLRHTNIVAYKDSFLDQDQYLNIVMIFCEGGDMYNKIKNAKSKNFPEQQVLDWFAQMALALFYLHDKKILHRDLKTQNIFLKHGRVRLGDFGIAKVLDSTRDFANTCIGTPYYMSPELFKYKPYSYKSDIWALGCVMYEICNLRHAFDAQSFHGLAAKIIKGSYPPITPTYTKPLRDLIGKMLNLNPKERPTILDILNKPVLKRRVIVYMTEIFSGNYPEANMPNDVDDIYLDSLKEQAEKLGIYSTVNDIIKNGGVESYKNHVNHYHDNSRMSVNSVPENKELKQIKDEAKVNKKQLKREVEEKKKIEDELKRLQHKEIIKKKILKEKINRSDSKKNFSHENLKKMPIKAEELKPSGASDRLKEDIKSKFKRSNSKEGKVNSSKIKVDSSIDMISLDDRKPSSKGTKLEVVSKKSSSVFGGASTEDEEKPRAKMDPKLRKLSAETASTEPTSQGISVGFHDKNIHEFLDRREQVLFEKEKKKREEQEKVEKALKAIRMENFEARKMAADRKHAQYRPSDDIVVAVPLTDGKSFDKRSTSNNLGGNAYDNTTSSNEKDDFQNENMEKLQSEEKKAEERNRKFKITEDYEMNDDNGSEEDEIIQEVDNEEEDGDDLNKIQERIENAKEKLNEKTMKINTLKQSLRQTKILEKSIIKKTQTRMEPPPIPVFDEEKESDDDESLDIDMSDEDSTEETVNTPNEEDIPEKRSYNPQYFKLQDRIKLLRHRCEAGLGFLLFDKVYKFLQEKMNTLKSDDLRKSLIEILGEDNIGFWHLVDQILLLEDFSKKLQETN